MSLNFFLKFNLYISYAYWVGCGCEEGGQLIGRKYGSPIGMQLSTTDNNNTTVENRDVIVHEEVTDFCQDTDAE